MIPNYITKWQTECGCRFTFQDFLGTGRGVTCSDTIAVKAIINRGYNGDSSIPEVPPDKISVIAKSLVVDSTTKLSKQDWKRDQQAHSDIGPIITLISNKALL